MIGALRITLSYFAFVPLQRWLNWIFGALMSLGLLKELSSDSPADQFGWMVLATLCALIVVAATAFAGGGAMHAASTPTMMHLRPCGRRQMLAGATLAIGLTAVLLTLPVMLLQISGAQVSIRNIQFSTPALSMFQLVWGSTSLSWVVAFALSRYRTLAPLSFGVVLAIGSACVQLSAWLALTADQFASVMCAIGVALWIAFAAWYGNAAAILVPRRTSGWTDSQPFRGLKGFNARWLGNREPGAVSRPLAQFQYLGSGSFLTQILIGGFITAMIWVLPEIFSKVDEARSPYQATGIGLVMFCALAMAPRMVQRSRLLWLRAGLDRAALFATAVRHAQLSMLATLSIPLVVFLALSLTQRPDLTLNILLFTVLQLTFAACLLYAGFTATRGSVAASVITGGTLLLVFVVTSRSMEPDKALSARAYLTAVAIFFVVALGLRWTARREWLTLDWRIAGPPLPAHSPRGR